MRYTCSKSVRLGTFCVFLIGFLFSLSCSDNPFDPLAICPDPVTGDINGDGIAYTVADAVMFSNYFIEGEAALTSGDTLRTKCASDINRDGKYLTLSDMVYLIRIIVGDAAPGRKILSTVPVTITIDKWGNLSVEEEMGAAFVLVRGDVHPNFLADNMEVNYAFDGENTRVLVYSIDGYSFTGYFLNAHGDIVSVELVTANAAPTKLSFVNRYPTQLLQNYPNPFNPNTTIPFNLWEEADYLLEIRNIKREVVKRFAGHATAGFHSLIWDATGKGAGVYYATLTVDDLSQTIEMALHKN